jgi:acetolactate synthase-1/2/3 large subunit
LHGANKPAVKPPPSGAVAQNSSGGISANLFSSFSGRVGQLNNQPADKILAAGDLVITIGYDPVEYWPSIRNKGNKRTIVRLDLLPADIDNSYSPAVELIARQDR